MVMRLLITEVTVRFSSDCSFILENVKKKSLKVINKCVDSLQFIHSVLLVL